MIAEQFIARWCNAGGSERANYHLFIAEAWLTVVRCHLAELRSSEVAAVPGDSIFERILGCRPGDWKARL
jgi:hypothetical protein